MRYALPTKNIHDEITQVSLIQMGRDMEDKGL